jgi:hypothetical protein
MLTMRRCAALSILNLCRIYLFSSFFFIYKYVCYYMQYIKMLYLINIWLAGPEESYTNQPAFLQMFSIYLAKCSNVIHQISLLSQTSNSHLLSQCWSFTTTNLPLPAIDMRSLRINLPLFSTVVPASNLAEIFPSVQKHDIFSMRSLV